MSLEKGIERGERGMSRKSLQKLIVRFKKILEPNPEMLSMSFKMISCRLVGKV